MTDRIAKVVADLLKVSIMLSGFDREAVMAAVELIKDLERGSESMATTIQDLVANMDMGQ